MNNVWNWVLIAVVVLLLIALPIMMNRRNKKETEKIQEQTNSLKVGDKILTTSGVYGTITELVFDESKKTVVIETGGKNKSYLTIDAYAIYTVFKSDAELAREAALKEDKENKEETKEKKSDKKKSENKDENVIVEEKPEETDVKVSNAKPKTKKNK